MVLKAYNQIWLATEERDFADELISALTRPRKELAIVNEDDKEIARPLSDPLFQIIQSQPASKQSSMATWFKNLMEGVERNLLTKNRDKFTQNLSVFRRDINDSLKGPNVTTTTVNDMMTS